MNIEYILLIFLIIFVVMYIISKPCTEDFTDGLTNIEKIKLEQCMVAVHEVFKENNVWYIIAFGSLLGAVRHRNMIPWDDDFDLLVKHDELDKIRKSLKQLEKLGYKTEETYKLMRVYASEKHFIDLFLIKEEDNKISRCYTQNSCKYPKSNEEWWHKHFNFPSDLIDKKKIYHIGPLSLWGPVDSWNLLRFWYGDDFLTVCKTHYLKNHNEYVEPEKEQCAKSEPPQF